MNLRRPRLSWSLPAVFGVLAVLALAAPVRAAMEYDATPTPNSPREYGAKVLVCNECHGKNGIPVSATIPIIWGQRENYLVKQLHDFDSGDRDGEVMVRMAGLLAQPGQSPAAANFAKKNWPARSSGAASAPSAPEPKGIGVCEACHGADFGGAEQAEGVATPRLAGQNYEYLVEQMRRFADGERKNNATMMQLMAAISPTDRAAMARYLSGL